VNSKTLWHGVFTTDYLGRILRPGPFGDATEQRLTLGQRLIIVLLASLGLGWGIWLAVSSLVSALL
jgi:hypothetical protein